MKKDNFSRLAEEAIAHIADQIESQDEAGVIDVDFLVDMLKLTTKKGEYIINKHSAAQEIWLASPVSGPYHFRLDKEIWVSKDGIELMSLLSEELSQFTKLEL